MERVKQKHKKQLKKGWILFAAVLVLAGVVAGIVLLDRAPADIPEEIAQEIKKAENVYVVHIPEEEITALSVFPRDYSAYELTVQDGKAGLLPDTSLPLRQDVVESILYAAGTLEASIVLGDAEALQATPADFGFDTPALRYVITRADGHETEVLLGDVVPETETEQYYCMANGVIYTVLAEPCDPMFHHADYLRDFRQPSLQSDLIDRIEVQGSVNMTLQYTPDGFVMETPLAYPVQKAKMDALLGYIDRMAFEAYLGPMEENDLKALGLQEPLVTVRLIQAPSHVEGISAEGEEVSMDVGEIAYTLLLGHDTGQSGVYVGWRGGVYKASNFLFGFWKELKSEEFYSRTPMNFPVERLLSVAVETAGDKAHYEVEMVEVIGDDNQIATDEYGQILYDAQVKKNGEIMDAATFMNWYVQLNKMAISGIGERADKAGEPVATLVFRTDATERSVVFRPYDALHVWVEVDGTAIFYTEKDAISVLNTLP